jgi:hypothetical protein
MSQHAGTFAAVFAALFVAHQFADHWVQTHHQAQAKGAAGWTGRLACAGHVATYTATAVVALVVAGAVLDLGLSVPRVAAGLVVSAVTHYWADRRFTLAALAERLGKGGFYRLGAPRPGRDDNPGLGTGAYALDQSFHIAFLFVAALVIAS